MKKQLKLCKIIYFITFLCLFFKPTILVNGETGNQRVFDGANLLTTEQVYQLEEVIDSLQQLTEADVVIATTEDARGKSTFDFADEFYDDHQFGVGAADSGMLLLIDLDNREFYIMTEGRMIDYFTDARIEAMLDHMADFIEVGDFFEAAGSFLREVEYFYKMGPVEGQYRLTDQRVFDRAQILSEQEVEELQRLINALELTMDLDLIVVTTDDLQDNTPSDYVASFYEAAGFHLRDRLDAALMLIDLEHNEIFIAATGSMQDYLPDSRLAMLKETIYDDIEQGQYFQGVQSFLRGVETFYEEGALRPPITVQEVVTMLVISIASGLLFYGFVVFKYQRNPKKLTFSSKQNSQINLTKQIDAFIHNRISKTRIPKNPPPSSTGGFSGGAGGTRGVTRSTTRTASSGRSRGGGGRSF